MSKFNTVDRRSWARGQGPIVAERTPSTVTHEGGAGFTRDARSELFMLGVANLVGEDTFYEKAADRDARYVRLAREVAVQDVGWLTRFVRWLRVEANMRSAPLVAAAEGVHARLAAGLHGDNRALIAAALDRADEPGELLAYWTAQYGRALPMAVKRGLADAARRLYNEFALLKYDTGSHGVRFADVIELAHPTPSAPWQDALFRYAIERRHGRDVDAEAMVGSLPMVAAQHTLRRVAAEDPTVLFDTGALRRAGMTWEDVLSLVGSQVSKARVWEALIPVMGLMALARNLRNFDKAGVSDEAAQLVAARFADPAQVGRSRMFPFRWLSAYEAAPSLRWGHPLDQALQASLGNLPALPGRTLIAVDTSGSMTGLGMSARSKVSPLKAAAVFGVALAAKGEQVDLVGFADGYRPFRHDVATGASVIREVNRFVARCGEDGHGTNIPGAVQRTFAGHDRVVIVSDMQTIGGQYSGGVSGLVPRDVPIYGFNLGGYAPTAADWGSTNRIELGGLTDATFRWIPLVEAGRRADWPF
jgi:hypothetical protein